MKLRPIPFAKAVARIWSAVPGSRTWAAGIWVFGLAGGAAGFVATLALPPAGAAVLWLGALALGLLLAFRAEPLLWTPDAAAERPEEAVEPPPELPASPAPPALLDMVPLPGGERRLGSPPATDAEIRVYAVEWAEVLERKPEESETDVRRWRQREEPAHRVRLSPFLMARLPVTRGQWRAVMPEAPAEWEADRSDDGLPATHVDWSQALAFCNALSAREGLAPCYRQDGQGGWQWDRQADGYRLPTEAEWEYACRAGTDTRWFWGDEAKGAADHAWYRGNAEGRLHPVGEKDPNPWQLRDMAGLVFEWCWDRFGPYRDDEGAPVQDPAGPEEGDLRVVRGGSTAIAGVLRRTERRGKPP